MIYPIKPIENYASYGGFASTIIDAWYRADSDNQMKIERNWEHLFEIDRFRLVRDRIEVALNAAIVEGFSVEVNPTEDGGHTINLYSIGEQA
jgi:hypothetical protein